MKREQITWLQNMARVEAMSPADFLGRVVEAAMVHERFDRMRFLIDLQILNARDDDPMWELGERMAAKEQAGLPADDGTAMGEYLAILARRGQLPEGVKHIQLEGGIP
jgi:hypothetical protein